MIENATAKSKPVILNFFEGTDPTGNEAIFQKGNRIVAEKYKTAIKNNSPERAAGGKL